MVVLSNKTLLRGAFGLSKRRDSAGGLAILYLRLLKCRFRSSTAGRVSMVRCRRGSIRALSMAPKLWIASERTFCLTSTMKHESQQNKIESTPYLYLNSSTIPASDSNRPKHKLIYPEASPIPKPYPSRKKFGTTPRGDSLHPRPSSLGVGESIHLVSLGHGTTIYPTRACELTLGVIACSSPQKGLRLMYLRRH